MMMIKKTQNQYSKNIINTDNNNMFCHVIFGLTNTHICGGGGGGSPSGKNDQK